MVRKVSTGQRKLIADYFANVGVAWFTVGVIGTILSGASDIQKAAITFITGLSLSFLSVFAGFYLKKKNK